MPFKSKAQARKFAEMVAAGEISKETFAEWSKATHDTSKLPERVPTKKSAKIQKVKVIK